MWSPDGVRLAYGSGNVTERRLTIAAADGTGVMQELPCPGAFCEPTDWSPDGRHLIVNTRQAMTGARGDVWRVSLESGGVSEAILAGRSLSTTRGSRRTAGGWPTSRRRPAARKCRLARCPARRDVSWSPTTAAANPCGAVMDTSCSTSMSEAVCVADRLHASRAKRSRSVLPSRWPCPPSVQDTGARSTTCRPMGNAWYFIDQTPAPRPKDINVVIGWRALLK